MSIERVHCFFEQSGTFKNEFINLGFKAFDYDLLNDFNQTDFIIDLFEQIDFAFDNLPSVFDSISSNDLIFAFFPCVRFEDQISLYFRGLASGQSSQSLEKRLVYDLKLHDELHLFYEKITKLVLICIRKNLKLIIENPYSSQHYLTRYWSFSPALIDSNRRERGDYFKKPTQYWFLNISPKSNFIWEPLYFVPSSTIESVSSERSVVRSLIHPQYAARFIREFIL